MGAREPERDGDLARLVDEPERAARIHERLAAAPPPP